ncbi:MAG: Smr/MutS family protein [Planctomycetota bacterium]
MNLAMARRRRRKIWETWDEDDDDLDGREDAVGAPGAPTVDLHGMTVDAALRRAAAELTRCRAGGARTLVLVTGQGFGSHGGRARLRPELERWLKGADAKRLGASSYRVLPQKGALEVTIQRR